MQCVACFHQCFYEGFRNNITFNELKTVLICKIKLIIYLTNDLLAFVTGTRSLVTCVGRRQLAEAVTQSYLIWRQARWAGLHELNKAPFCCCFSFLLVYLILFKEFVCV